MTQRGYEANLKSPHLSAYAKTFDSPLDRWISYAVKVLNEGGVETYESCQGGPGHSYPDPSVRFHGASGEGFRAFSVAVSHGLPVLHLSRLWTVNDGELTGPTWEMTFRRARLRTVQADAERCGILDAVAKGTRPKRRRNA